MPSTIFGESREKLNKQRLIKPKIKKPFDKILQQNELIIPLSNPSFNNLQSHYKSKIKSKTFSIKFNLPENSLLCFLKVHQEIENITSIKLFKNEEEFTELEFNIKNSSSVATFNFLPMDNTFSHETNTYEYKVTYITEMVTNIYFFEVMYKILL